MRFAALASAYGCFGTVVSRTEEFAPAFEAAAADSASQLAVFSHEHAGAGATDYLHLLGLTALGWMWGRIAKAAIVIPKAPTAAALTGSRWVVIGRWPG